VITEFNEGQMKFSCKLRMCAFGKLMQ